MRRLLLSLLILAAPFSPVVAQEKSAANAPRDTPELEALIKEYEAANKKFSLDLRKSYESAKKAGKQEAFEFKEDHPSIRFSRRFLAIAAKAPETPSGFNALRMAINTSGGPQGKAGTWPKGIELLREHYADKPGIKRLIVMVAGFGDEAGDRFVRDVIAKNPDRELQAKAYQSLAEAREDAADSAKILKENAALRARFEKLKGKQEVAQRIARGDAARKEAEELRKTLREQYRDLVADLSIGQPAPELVSEDIQGKAVKLSDLRGKVVVLDIWATWCAPCRAAIPGQREMVERLQGKPFQMVSISADEEKKTLVDFLARQKMPWDQWWSGPEGKVMDQLNIQHYPTIFVIDAKGIIRHKELRGEALEKAVADLLNEMGVKVKTSDAK